MVRGAEEMAAAPGRSMVSKRKLGSTASRGEELVRGREGANRRSTSLTARPQGSGAEAAPSIIQSAQLEAQAPYRHRAAPTKTANPKATTPSSDAKISIITLRTLNRSQEPSSATNSLAQAQHSQKQS